LADHVVEEQDLARVRSLSRHQISALREIYGQTIEGIPEGAVITSIQKVSQPLPEPYWTEQQFEQEFHTKIEPDLPSGAIIVGYKPPSGPTYGMREGKWVEVKERTGWEIKYLPERPYTYKITYETEKQTSQEIMVEKTPETRPTSWTEWLQRGWVGFTRTVGELAGHQYDPMKTILPPAIQQRVTTKTITESATIYYTRKLEGLQEWILLAPMEERALLHGPEIAKTREGPYPIIGAELFTKQHPLTPVARAVEFGYAPIGVLKAVESIYRPQVKTFTGAVASTVVSAIPTIQVGPHKLFAEPTTTEPLSQYAMEIQRHPALLMGEVAGEYLMAKYIWGPALQKTWRGMKWAGQKAIHGYVAVGRVTAKRVIPATIRYGFEPIAKRVAGEEVAYYFGRVGLPQLPSRIATGIGTAGSKVLSGMKAPVIGMKEFFRIPLAEIVAELSHAKWRATEPFARRISLSGYGLSPQFKYALSEMKEQITTAKWRVTEPFHTHKIIPSLRVSDELRYAIESARMKASDIKWRLTEPFYTHRVMPRYALSDELRYALETTKLKASQLKWRLTDPFYRMGVPSVSWRPSIYGKDLFSQEMRAYNKVIAGRLRHILRLRTPTTGYVPMKPFISQVAKRTGKKMMEDFAVSFKTSGYWQVMKKPIMDLPTKTVGTQLATRVTSTALMRTVTEAVQVKREKARKEWWAWKGPTYPRIMEQDLWTSITSTHKPFPDPEKKLYKQLYKTMLQREKEISVLELAKVEKQYKMETGKELPDHIRKHWLRPIKTAEGFKYIVLTAKGLKPVSEISPMFRTPKIKDFLMKLGLKGVILESEGKPEGIYISRDQKKLDAIMRIQLGEEWSPEKLGLAFGYPPSAVKTLSQFIEEDKPLPKSKIRGTFFRYMKGDLMAEMTHKHWERITRQFMPHFMRKPKRRQVPKLLQRAFELEAPLSKQLLVKPFKITRKKERKKTVPKSMLLEFQIPDQPQKQPQKQKDELALAIKSIATQKTTEQLIELQIPFPIQRSDLEPPTKLRGRQKGKRRRRPISPFMRGEKWMEKIHPIPEPEEMLARMGF